jgi:hypothetical protein
MERSISLALSALFSGVLFAQTVFTSSGTFVVPAGVDTVTFELVGAGGNGGFNGGGGGGGGGYAKRTIVAAPGTSYSIVVGGGGSGLATIVGGLGVLANAGGEGTSVGNPEVGGGGVGGTAFGGDVNRTGGAGGGGYYTYFGGGGGGAAGPLANGGVGGNTIVYNGSNCITPGGSAGVAGGSPAGNGGKGSGFLDSDCTISDLNTDGVPYGGGGGGGNGIGSQVGIGGGGLCVVTWSGSNVLVEPMAERDLRVRATVFTDRITLAGTNGTERYELLEPSGRMIWAGQNIEDRDFSALPPMAYFLRVSVEGVVRTFKMIKPIG